MLRKLTNDKGTRRVLLERSANASIFCGPACYDRCSNPEVRFDVEYRLDYYN
jgi:hypothetical protein